MSAPAKKSPYVNIFLPKQLKELNSIDAAVKRSMLSIIYLKMVSLKHHCVTSSADGFVQIAACVSVPFFVNFSFSSFCALGEKTYARHLGA